jgi:hypothetical protein
MSQTAALPTTFRQILGQTLDADFRREVLETFLTDREARPVVQEALRTVAALRKLRPQTIAQLGRAERLNLFLGALSQPAFENSAMQSLQVWFLRKGRTLMSQLLDAWGVSHKDGELEDDAVVPPVTADKVRSAIADLGEKFPSSAINAYLGYSHLAPPGESWSEACGIVLLERLSA